MTATEVVKRSWRRLGRAAIWAAPACLVIVILGPSALANDTAPGVPTTMPAMRKAIGPYCGLLSLYAAIRYENGRVQFSSLLKPVYLHSSRGSSLSEIEQAARDCGFSSVPVEDVNEAFLRDLSHPLILHVKKDFNSTQYDHYIVCLRAAWGGERVFDPPDDIESLTFQQLLERSDRAGLVISSSSNEKAEAAVFRPYRLRIMLFGSIGLLAAGALNWEASRRRLRGRELPSIPRAVLLRMSLSQFIMIALVAASSGLAGNVLASHGLFAAPMPLDESGRAKPSEVVGAWEVRRTIKEGGTFVLVDARLQRDFLLGHIPGALNIPVDSDQSERRRVLNGVSPDTPIIIYCESSECSFSDLVAAGLRSDGFTHLEVYRDGWKDWTLAGGAREN